jgi:hypothetical protein
MINTLRRADKIKGENRISVGYSTGQIAPLNPRNLNEVEKMWLSVE